MKMIELHNRGYSLAFNLEHICAIAPGNGGTLIWMAGIEDNWTVDESYGEVLCMLREEDCEVDYDE